METLISVLNLDVKFVRTTKLGRINTIPLITGVFSFSTIFGVTSLPEHRKRVFCLENCLAFQKLFRKIVPREEIRLER